MTCGHDDSTVNIVMGIIIIIIIIIIIDNNTARDKRRFKSKIANFSHPVYLTPH